MALDPSHMNGSLFLFVSLVIQWFGLALSVLCQISPFRVSSWDSTLVLSLRTDDTACASAPNSDWL